MYLLYSLLLTLGFLILLPRFIVDALRSGKYVTGLRQRLGNIPPLNRKGEPVIWLHCVSVGETRAAQPLVNALLERFPSLTLVVSTTTVTGQQVARDIFRNQAAAIFYFPIDWAWTVRRTVRVIEPAAVLLMETELWPNLLRECNRREIPVSLVNGRISKTSFRRYAKIKHFIKRVLTDLTFAAMQSREDAERIRELGLTDDRIIVTGNLKFDSAATSSDEQLTEENRQRFQFDAKRALIVAASTHAPEEAIIFVAFKRARLSHPNARLLIAPRHPERFEEVASLLKTTGFSFTLRSKSPSAPEAECDVILLDTIGELRAVYPLADIVFVGGSVTPHGGQNMLEPAAYGICTVTGPHTSNFAAITKALLEENALIQTSAVSPEEATTELADIFTRLLNDDEARRRIGRRAKSVCHRNQGATEQTLGLISQILSAPATTDHEVLSFSTLPATTSK